MAATEFGILGIVRITEIFDALQDVRQMPKNLTFNARNTKVPATDADIIARFLNQVHTADIVGDDQKASTYAAGRIKFEANMIPNIKFGKTISQEDWKRLEFMDKNKPLLIESLQYEEYFMREAESLLVGIDYREETLNIGMEIDQFTYNHNGIIMNLTWGMPAELKVTSAVAWTDPVNSTPVTDILNTRLIASTKYGKVYDRIKLSTPAFRLLIQSAQFAAQVKLFLPVVAFGAAVPSIPLQELGQLKNLVGQILDMSVELYDARFPFHPADGTAPVYSPGLPLNLVILDSKENDNNVMFKDFANGVVTESLVAQISSAVFKDVERVGGAYGPYSYVTIPADRNPPTSTWWAVSRGMPRKKQEALTAVINIGTVVDFIAPGITF